MQLRAYDGDAPRTRNNPWQSGVLGLHTGRDRPGSEDQEAIDMKKTHRTHRSWIAGLAALR
jgi:hypothetical protein